MGVGVGWVVLVGWGVLVGCLVMVGVGSDTGTIVTQLETNKPNMRQTNKTEMVMVLFIFFSWLVDINYIRLQNNY